MADNVALIVDDDPSLGQSLIEALAGAPIRVDLAADADAAIEMLTANHYCGLVLDLVLKNSSGFDVLRFMERQRIRVPTVIVTQKLPAYVREMLDEEQVKLVFPKPVQPKLLATVVLGLCGLSA